MPSHPSSSSVRDPAAWEITHQGSNGPAVRRPLLAARDLPLDVFTTIREFPRYPGQRNRTCEYFAATTNDYVACESKLERQIAQILDFDNDVVAIVSQPFGVHVLASGQPLVPDFLAVHRDGARRVIDVSPAEYVGKEKRSIGFQRKRTACELLGWEYEVLTEPPPALARNIEALAGFRFAPPALADLREAAIRAFSPPAPLGRTAARVGPTVQSKPVVFHLCWRRILEYDLAEALSDSTLVGVRP